MLNFKSESRLLSRKFFSRYKNISYLVLSSIIIFEIKVNDEVNKQAACSSFTESRSKLRICKIGTLSDFGSHIGSNDRLQYTDFKRSTNPDNCWRLRMRNYTPIYTEYIVYTHGLTDLCTYALRIMGSYYFLATFTILQVHHR